MSENLVLRRCSKPKTEQSRHLFCNPQLSLVIVCLTCLEGAHLLDHDLNQAIQKFRFKKSKGKNKYRPKNPTYFWILADRPYACITHNCNSSSSMCWITAFCQDLLLKKIKHHDKFQHAFYSVPCTLSSLSSCSVLDSVQTERHDPWPRGFTCWKHGVPGRSARNEHITRVMKIWHTHNILSKMRTEVSNHRYKWLPVIPGKALKKEGKKATDPLANLCTVYWAVRRNFS